MLIKEFREYFKLGDPGSIGCGNDFIIEDRVIKFINLVTGETDQDERELY